jgi:hypothetical protein
VTFSPPVKPSNILLSSPLSLHASASSFVCVCSSSHHTFLCLPFHAQYFSSVVVHPGTDHRSDSGVFVSVSNHARQVRRQFRVHHLEPQNEQRSGSWVGDVHDLGVDDGGLHGSCGQSGSRPDGSTRDWVGGGHRPFDCCALDGCLDESCEKLWTCRSERWELLGRSLDLLGRSHRGCCLRGFCVQRSFRQKRNP